MAGARASGGEAPALLERTAELDALRTRMHQARAGEGSLTLVLGEAGIGKTSLVRAATRHRPAGLRLLWGACDALSTPRPLAPLHDIALAAGSEFAAVMAAEVAKHDRFAAALAELTAPRPPAVVVIEDVHWADDATRDLLVFLGRRIDATRAAVIVTGRDDGLDRDHPLTGTLGRLATTPAVRRIELGPLGRASVAMLAGGLDADAIYATTAGNPFFVTELVEAHSAAAVPSSVRAAVLARAGALGRDARHALDAAALIARAEVEVDLVLTAAEVDAEALDECLRSGLLRGRPGRIAFRHELARRAVEDSVPPAAAAQLHRRLVVELEQRGADPARLAHHAERAGDDVRTARYGIDAAGAAAREGAHRSAAGQYERALASGALAAETAALAWESLARERAAFVDDGSAVDACRRARAIWRDLRRPDDEGRALAMAARALWAQGRGEAARAAVREAIGGFDDRAESAALAVALSIGAQLHMLAREVDEAIELGHRAAEIADRFGDDRTRAGALNAVGSALWFVDPDAAEKPLVQSRWLAERLGDDIGVANALINLGSGAGEVRRYRQADGWLRTALNWCADRDLDHSAAYATAWLARSLFEQGEWAAATALAESVRADPNVIARIVALVVLGRIATRSGAAGAEELLQEAGELAERTGDLQRLWPVAAAQAESAWLRSEPERIRALVADTYRRAVELRQRWPIGELGFWLWRAGELTELPDRAAGPFAAHVQGELAAAAAGWDAIGVPYEAAVALADGGPDDLVAAITRLDALGARPAANAAAGRLRALDPARMPRRPRPETVANPAGLTQRELEVTALIAAGLTDAGVAARLHISPKTAGHHVSAILAKLGVASRFAVADAAARHGVRLP